MRHQTMRIFIEDTFDSAHSLPHLPETHKCHHLHGHTYRVRLEVIGPLTDDGWIVDYSVIKSHWQIVKNRLDHKFINEIVPLSTCENLALYVMNEMSRRLSEFGPPMIKMSGLELRETEKCGVVLEAK